MARVLGLLPAALLSARAGQSANAFYRELQALGTAPRRSEALQIHGVARGIVTRTPREPFQPLNQIPILGPNDVWPSKNAQGVVQTVSLLYRDKITGQIQQTWWRTVTPDGITREEALARAVDAYSEHAEQYAQDIIGAIHTSAYRLVPGLGG